MYKQSKKFFINYSKKKKKNMMKKVRVSEIYVEFNFTDL